MERLTHEADFGLEDWEETLFFVKSDPNGAYNIIDIAKYQGEPEFDEILKNVALRLAAYEETGLEPEEVSDFDRLVKLYLEAGLDKQFVLACIEATKAGMTVDRLRELAKADREGKIPKYTIGDTVYDRFGNVWEVTAVELHSMRTKNEWLYRCGHKGTDDYCALWHFEAFPSREAALRRERDG